MLSTQTFGNQNSFNEEFLGDNLGLGTLSLLTYFRIVKPIGQR